MMSCLVGVVTIASVDEGLRSRRRGLEAAGGVEEFEGEFEAFQNHASLMVNRVSVLR